MAELVKRLKGTQDAYNALGDGVSDDTLYFTTEFPGDTELNTGRIYLGGTLVGKPLMWEDLPKPSPSPYQMVDLGLSVKWADRNVGAARPEEYGDYFAWGETAPRGENWSADTPYDWAHAPFNNGSSTFDSGHFSTVSATVCPQGVLAPEYDAARANMGGSWRTPTSAEMQELLDGTVQTVEEVNGVKGMRFTSKSNGNSIFIPFCGYRYDSDADDMGDYGYAWSSSLDTDNADNSRGLDFYYDGYTDVFSDYRYIGFVVRGVC